MDGWTWFTYLNLLPIALHTLIHVGCVVDVPGTLTYERIVITSGSLQTAKTVL